MSTTTVATQPTTSRQVDSGRRREVDMVRALAVALVVVHHVFTGRVSGGVDVFFLLSGLLVTLSFLRRADPGPGRDPLPWSLWQTLTARFTRLVPLMAVVLVTVLAAATVLVPPLRWHSLLQQTVASITFIQNQVLAGLSVDYYANNRAAAPILQHNWSMAVTGQAYLLWALLFAAVLLVARWTRLRVLPVLTTVMVLLFAASLTASVIQTAATPAPAYFLTLPRLWEFAAGSLLGIVLHRHGTTLAAWGQEKARWLLPSLGWAGVAGLLACGALQPTPAHFPGLLSLWPIGAGAAIVLAGDSGRFGMASVLDTRVTRWLSKHSYGLFLWHWPVLVLWQQQVERAWATWYDGLAIVLITVLLTTGGDVVVERGMAVLRRRRMVLLAAAVAVVMLPVVVWNGALTKGAASVAAQAADDNPGALVLHPDYVDNTSPEARVAPFDADVESEWANLPDVCALPDDTEPMIAENCLEYRPEGEPTRTVIVLGDSRSQQWTAAIEPVARDRDWHVMAVTLHQCAYTGQREDLSEICNDFNAAAQDFVLTVQPDAVTSVATRTFTDETPEMIEPAYEAGVEPFLAEDITVVAIRDTPRFDFDVPECVQRHGIDSPRCQVPRSQVLAEESPLASLPAHDRWAEMDLNPVVCPTEMCPGIVGNVYVYMDIHHLSKTYAATMSRAFAEAWFRATSGGTA